MTAKKIKTAVQVVFSCAFWNMVSSPTGKSHEKKTQNCLSTLAFYFWDFLQNCCVKQFCKNWDLLFLTPSWSFLQEKRCKWLVSKDKSYGLHWYLVSSPASTGWVKSLEFYISIPVNLSVFLEKYRILPKNVLALLIYFHLRDYKTKKLSRKTSSSLSTWLNNAILGGIPVAETHTPGVANSWVPRDSVSVTLWWRLRSTMMTATQTMVTATTPPTTPTVTTWTGTEEPLSSSKTVSTDDIK